MMRHPFLCYVVEITTYSQKYSKNAWRCHSFKAMGKLFGGHITHNIWVDLALNNDLPGKWSKYASIWTYGPGRFLKKAEIRKTGRARPFLGVGPQYMGY